VAAPESRPAAADWVGALEGVLDSMGAADVADSVRVNQGGGEALRNSGAVTGPLPVDVDIRPVARAAPRPEPRLTRVPLRPSSGGGFRSAPSVHSTTAPSVGSAAGPDRGTPATVQFLTTVIEGLKWWKTAHRQAAVGLVTGGRRAQGLASLALCMVIDTLALVAGLFLVAMIVAPISGL
jgi:hypothetical protein